jgi:hypothetical protein
MMLERTAETAYSDLPAAKPVPRCHCYIGKDLVRLAHTADATRRALLATNLVGKTLINITLEVLRGLTKEERDAVDAGEVRLVQCVNRRQWLSDAEVDKILRRVGVRGSSVTT